MSIFEPRTTYKPFEYPDIMQYVEAINRTFWVHSEVDFTADVQDFHTQLSDAEKQTIKRSLLAIAQIEVAVKGFWGNLYQQFPKPEFNGLGSTFAECEFRHSEAYSRLLDVLGYSQAFDQLLEVEVIQKRFDYLQNALQYSADDDKKKYVFSLILFTILIENVSLFSQFAIILSFTRFKGIMKNISNIIAWTSTDEQIHAQAGIYLVNQIKKENPEFFDADTIQEITALIKDAMAIEEEILDWIFESGELEAFNQKELMDFMKYRIDNSLEALEFDKIYHITSDAYEPMRWFDEEVLANSLDDFFAKRPVEYTKHDKSIKVDDLF